MLLTEIPADRHPDSYLFREDGQFFCCESGYVSAQGTYSMTNNILEIVITNIDWQDGPSSRVDNKWRFMYNIEENAQIAVDKSIYRCDKVFVTDKPLHIVMCENINNVPSLLNKRPSRFFIGGEHYSKIS